MAAAIRADQGGKARELGIGVIAYVLASLAGGAVIASRLGARLGFEHILYTFPVMVAIFALLPFLLVKLIMALVHRDGPVAHLLGGGVAALWAGAVLFQEALWSLEPPRLGMVLGLAGGLAGAVYWAARRAMRLIWKGKTA